VIIGLDLGLDIECCVSASVYKLGPECDEPVSRRNQDQPQTIFALETVQVPDRLRICQPSPELRFDIDNRSPRTVPPNEIGYCSVGISGLRVEDKIVGKRLADDSLQYINEAATGCRTLVEDGKVPQSRDFRRYWTPSDQCARGVKGGWS
jgi:hypothetical protein